MSLITANIERSNVGITNDQVEVKESWEMDLLDILNDTYLLITPANKEKCKGNGLPLDSGKMLTMSADEFLTAFHSLLAVYEDDCSETNETAISSLNADEHSSTPQAVSGKMDTTSPPQSRTLKERATSKSLVSVATQTYIEITPNFAEATSTSSQTCVRQQDKSTMIHEGDLSCQSQDKQSTERGVLSKPCKLPIKFGSNFTDQQKEVTHDELKLSSRRGRSMHRDSDLKRFLLRVNPKIRDICLEDFVPLWTTTKVLKQLSPFIYMYAHLGLLLEFVQSWNDPVDSRRELLERYMTHLQKVTSRFGRKNRRTEDVIEFDQTVLSYARETGAWEFSKAWSSVERERKRKSESTKTAIKSKDSSKPKMLFGKYLPPRIDQGKRKHDQVNDENVRSQSNAISSAPPQARSHGVYPPLAGDRNYGRHTNRDENEMGVGKSKTPYAGQSLFIENDSEKKHGAKLSSPIDNYGVAGTKRKRFEVGLEACDPRSRRISRISDDGKLSDTRKYLANKQDNKKLARTFCKYFNARGCLKSTSQCYFQHVCCVCKSPSHGRTKCYRQDEDYSCITSQCS